MTSVTQTGAVPIVQSVYIIQLCADVSRLTVGIVDVDGAYD